MKKDHGLCHDPFYVAYFFSAARSWVLLVPWV